MRVYTYSEARQNLASLLDIAQRDGAVRIRRKDGQSFVLQRKSAEAHRLTSSLSRSMLLLMRLCALSARGVSAMADITLVPMIHPRAFLPR